MKREGEVMGIVVQNKGGERGQGCSVLLYLIIVTPENEPRSCGAFRTKKAPRAIT